MGIHEGKIHEFLEVQNRRNRVALNVFKKLDALGYGDDFLQEYGRLDSIERMVLDLKPTDQRGITTICSVLRSYARFTGDADALQVINDIDRNALWDKIKNTVPRKYITYQTYLDTIKKIGQQNDLNYLYYRALFRVIYEGVYSEDLSVISNLRASDIHGREVKVHNDNGNEYALCLPAGVIDDLKDLSKTHEWEQMTIRGVARKSMEGRHVDSCFKITSKMAAATQDHYKTAYYKRLRKITSTYLGDYNVKPLQLFISGIIHRVCLGLKENGMTLQGAVTGAGKNIPENRIIKEELKRCNYLISVPGFKEQIRGHIDIFFNDEMYA